MDEQQIEETVPDPAPDEPAAEPEGDHPTATEHTSFVVEDEELA
jgi:hypothetical protein